MRKSLIVIFILIVISLQAKSFNFYPGISLESGYNSNILSLSENDLQRFESGEEPDKFKIETSDDMVVAAKLNLNFKHYLMAGHTQINTIGIKYNKYYSNDIKDNFYLKISLKQFLSRKLNFGFYYYFYPEIYVNRYDSVTEDENIFRDFTYSKNNFIGKINYKFNNKYRFNYRFSFSQLCYNKYFTEYDALNFENGFGISIRPNNWLKIITGYNFTISNAAAGDAYKYQEVSIIKDGSYQEDTFDLSLNFPSIISVFSKTVDLGLGGKYEIKYYQAEDELDEYHYGRKDNTISLDAELQSKLSKSFSFKCYSSLKFRSTVSPYTHVVRDKEFEQFESGITLSYNL